MFEVTAEQIERLTDEHLRELIARLCEAEVRGSGQSPLAVTWGGNQASADGGIDVRVSLDQPLPSPSNLPRARIGFQVKAEDMPRSAILAEMRPDGVLRPSIQALAAEFGAYILVSSRGSLSDTSLNNRRSAMAEAVQGEAGAPSLHLDFFDRTRIATWVREHPGLVLWVREKIGASIQGWWPFGDWAYANEGLGATYLLDAALRIQGPYSKNSSVEQGFTEIRARLSTPRGVVRLVGLSGTGKTRFVQALFDDRIGTDALVPALAVYTNLSADPSPQPVALCTDLINQRKQAIIVVDNCRPDLHRTLANVCQQPDSQLSLITVEYDVREDQPEGTDVFELQPASDDLIKSLLRRRYPDLSPVNVERLAEFSGGNARVALALAGTVGRGVSLAELRETDLFERLFHQRQGEDRSLLRIGQACSLVYSFQGEDTSQSDEAELWRLAAVFDVALRAFYESLRELQNRDLLQKRGVWRAILPHAIANRLAASALENIPPAELEVFWRSLPSRLLRSFSRRLSYLHTSEQAVALVRGWLSPDGLLGRVEDLNDLRIAMLVNVAPVAPVEALNAIQRASDRERAQGRSLQGDDLRGLVRSLAFEAELFDQAFSLLVDLVEADEPRRYVNAPRNDLPSMFHLVLSGTHATVEQRVAAIERLIDSGSDQRCEMGFACLNGLLQTPPFTGYQHFEFGARPRDYGYEPRTREDVQHWFVAALALCGRVDGKGADASERVRKIVSERLWGIWTTAGSYTEVETLFQSFGERRYWPTGWIAVRSLRKFREEPLPPEQDECLRRIEAALQPHSLQERVRVFVLRRVRSGWDDIGYKDYEAQYSRLRETVIELGRLTAQEAAAFDELLPELMSAEKNMMMGEFAKGVVDSGVDPGEVWTKASRVFEEVAAGDRNIEFLACFLFNLSSLNFARAEELLADAFTNSVLKPLYPYLQSRVPVGNDSMVRLRECLADDSVPVESFRNLGWSRPTCSDEQLASLLPLIALKPGGFTVALDCVWIRVAVKGRDNEPPPAEVLISAGRELLVNHVFDRENGFEHYHYCEIARSCLSGPGNEVFVDGILNRVHAAAQRGLGISLHDAPVVVSAMLEVQPIAALDTLFANRSTEYRGGMEYLLDRYDTSGLDVVPEPLLLDWCDQQPGERHLWVAANLCFFTRENTSDVRQWKPKARSLLFRAPNRIAVMQHFIDQLRPMSWTGSRAETWNANLTLLLDLDAYGDYMLEAFVREQQGNLIREVEQLQRSEAAFEKQHNERFE